MTMFIIQTVILLTIAFLLGCILGTLLHRLFSGSGKEKTAVSPPAEASKVRKPVEKPQPPKKEAEPEPKQKSEPKPKTESKPKTAAKPKAKTEPVSKPKPKPAPKPAAEEKDDLKRIRGIGPQNEAKLNSVGITTFSQIAGWSAKEQEDMGERLAFPGRIEREDWVEQAKLLAKGEETEFAKRVDSGEVESSKGSAPAVDVGSRPASLSAAPEGGVDDLTLIDGVGNAIEKKLFGLGIYSFEQISKWSKPEQAWIGNELGFPGRPERENWVEEAKKLATGAAPEKPKPAKRGAIITSKKSRK